MLSPATVSASLYYFLCISDVYEINKITATFSYKKLPFYLYYSASYKFLNLVRHPLLNP